MGLLPALPPLPPLLPIADIYILVRLSLSLSARLSPVSQLWGDVNLKRGGNYIHIVLVYYTILMMLTLDYFWLNYRPF